MTTLPNAAFSIALDCQLDNVPGTLGRLCAAIGEAGGNIGALDGFDIRGTVPTFVSRNVQLLQMA